jgi:transcriptional regulator with XRE-family HTH domain
MNTIGYRIKELRESKGINAKDLCETLEINPSTYSKLENDKKSIDVDELRKLTKFYQVSADHLLGTNKAQEDIVVYMTRDKKLGDEDVKEVQMVMDLMDEALTLQSQRDRV